MSVNPNEAPRGHIAVEDKLRTCSGCAFNLGDCAKPKEATDCVGGRRYDKTNVIFIDPLELPHAR